MLWVLGLVLKAWLTSEMHLQKNPGSRDRSNQLAEGPHQSKVNYGKRFSLNIKNWIWWWRQNWNGATMLLIWFKNLQSVEQWQDKKGQNILTPSGRLKNVFSGRQIGSSSRRDTCSFLHSHATGDRETTWEENGRRKKISPWASILFSTESEETDWRERLVQSKGQSCD